MGVFVGEGGLRRDNSTWNSVAIPRIDTQDARNKHTRTHMHACMHARRPCVETGNCRDPPGTQHQQRQNGRRRRQRRRPLRLSLLLLERDGIRPSILVRARCTPGVHFQSVHKRAIKGEREEAHKALRRSMLRKYCRPSLLKHRPTHAKCQAEACQVMPNDAKSCQMMPRYAKSYQIIPNHAKSSQIIPKQANHPKSSQIKPNNAKSC